MTLSIIDLGRLDVIDRFFCALTILSTIRDLLTIAVRDNWSISTHSNVVINRLKMCNSDFMTKVYSLHTSITWKLLLNCTIGFLHPDERWKVTLALFCFLWSDSLFDILWIWLVLNFSYAPSWAESCVQVNCKKNLGLAKPA